MAEQTLTPPGAQVQAATLTTATTGLVVYGVEQAWFHGSLPGPVYGFLQLAVPAACGLLAAQLAYWRARRRLDCPKGA